MISYGLCHPYEMYVPIRTYIFVRTVYADAGLRVGGRVLHLVMADRIGEDLRARIAPHWDDILDAVGAGELGVTLESAAKAIAGVGIRSVQRYARQTPGAREQLDRALSDGADALVERLPSLIIAEVDARRARVLVDTLFRIAAARDPGRYGAKASMTLNVRTVDLTQIINDANARLAASRAITATVIEGAALRVPAELSDLL